MRGRKKLNQGDEVTDINISPLIDMVFILLIFFIVTTVFIEEKGMVAATPDPNPNPDPPAEEEERVSFLVKANGAVEYKGSDVGVGGVRAIVRPAMQREVYPITVNVEPNSIMDVVVRVMDECYLGNAEQVTMKAVTGANGK